MLSLEHHGAVHKPLLSWISQFENLRQPGQELWASTVCEVAASTSGCSSVLNAHQAAAHSSQLQGVHNKGMQKHRRVRFVIKSMHYTQWWSNIYLSLWSKTRSGKNSFFVGYTVTQSCSKLDELYRHNDKCEQLTSCN